MAKRPEPTWVTDYQHDRRAHRHRCRHCNRVINSGERVLMARISGGGTLAVHIECADKQHAGVMTVREAMEAWGLEALRRLGWAA